MLLSLSWKSKSTSPKGISYVMMTRSALAYWMPFWMPRRSWQSARTGPTYSLGTWIVIFTMGSSMRSMNCVSGSFAGFSTRTFVAVGLVDLVDDARRRRDEVQVELALEALLDDLHVEEPQKPAAEAEAERLGRVGLVGEGGVVQVELLQRVAEGRVVRAVGREDARRRPSA